nr:hypothetical protein [Burkholderia sp. AU16741]
MAVPTDRADQRLELADAPDRDLEVGAEQRGEQRWIEGFDGDQTEYPQREGRCIRDVFHRAPQAEVLAGRQPVLRPRERIGGQLRAPQQFVDAPAEVDQHDLPARRNREAVQRRNCPVSTSCWKKSFIDSASGR